jgi:hypothetical protein
MTFRAMTAVVSVTIGALGLAGCGDVKKGFDEGFDKGGKESFVRSCIKGTGPRIDAATATTLCTCIADYMQTHLTRAELINPVSAHADKVGDEATAACTAKHFPDDGR